MHCQRVVLGIAGLLALAACGGRPVHVAGTGGDAVSGVTTYRETTPWPADAELDVRLEDASAPSASAAVVAQGTIRTEGAQPPFAFALRYDDDRIEDDHTYVVRAALRSGGRVLYETQADTLVITRGHTDHVTLVLMPVEAAPTPPSAPITGLAGTSWRLEDLAGTPVVEGADATLDFLDGERVAGNGSCNRFTGTAKVSGTSITFGTLAATQMACPESVGAQEARYLKALAAAERYAFDGPALQIFSKGLSSPLRFVRRPASSL
jgi:putative lipoprotein